MLPKGLLLGVIPDSLCVVHRLTRHCLALGQLLGFPALLSTGSRVELSSEDGVCLLQPDTGLWHHGWLGLGTPRKGLF